MADYIDIDEPVIQATRGGITKIITPREMFKHYCIAFKKADVAEIVHCKDCEKGRHIADANTRNLYQCEITGHYYVGTYYYCANGRRRGDG